MLTIRQKVKPVWHQTGLRDPHSGRAYLVAETPVNLLVRLKGTREVLSLPWNIAYLRAALLAAAENQVQKIRRRSVRRGTLAMK